MGCETKKNSLAGIQYFNGVLSDNEYVAGKAFSSADITLYAGLAFADFAGIEHPENCGKLSAWQSMIALRPSIAG
jgi:glutathione S-transferase